MASLLMGSAGPILLTHCLCSNVVKALETEVVLTAKWFEPGTSHYPLDQRGEQLYGYFVCFYYGLTMHWLQCKCTFVYIFITEWVTKAYNLLLQQSVK